MELSELKSTVPGKQASMLLSVALSTAATKGASTGLTASIAEDIVAHGQATAQNKIVAYDVLQGCTQLSDAEWDKIWSGIKLDSLNLQYPELQAAALETLLHIPPSRLANLLSHDGALKELLREKLSPTHAPVVRATAVSVLAHALIVQCRDESSQGLCGDWVERLTEASVDLSDVVAIAAFSGLQTLGRPFRDGAACDLAAVGAVHGSAEDVEVGGARSAWAGGATAGNALLLQARAWRAACAQLLAGFSTVVARISGAVTAVQVVAIPCLVFVLETLLEKGGSPPEQWGHGSELHDDAWMLGVLASHCLDQCGCVDAAVAAGAAEALLRLSALARNYKGSRPIPRNPTWSLTAVEVLRALGDRLDGGVARGVLVAANARHMHTLPQDAQTAMAQELLLRIAGLPLAAARVNAFGHVWRCMAELEADLQSARRRTGYRPLLPAGIKGVLEHPSVRHALEELEDASTEGFVPGAMRGGAHLQEMVATLHTVLLQHPQMRAVTQLVATPPPPKVVDANGALGDAAQMAAYLNVRVATVDWISAIMVALQATHPCLAWRGSRGAVDAAGAPLAADLWLAAAHAAASAVSSLLAAVGVAGTEDERAAQFERSSGEGGVAVRGLLVCGRALQALLHHTLGAWGALPRAVAPRLLWLCVLHVDLTTRPEQTWATILHALGDLLLASGHATVADEDANMTAASAGHMSFSGHFGVDTFLPATLEDASTATEAEQVAVWAAEQLATRLLLNSASVARPGPRADLARCAAALESVCNQFAAAPFAHVDSAKRLGRAAACARQTRQLMEAALRGMAMSPSEHSARSSAADEDEERHASPIHRDAELEQLPEEREREAAAVNEDLSSDDSEYAPRDRRVDVANGHPSPHTRDEEGYAHDDDDGTRQRAPSTLSSPRNVTSDDGAHGQGPKARVATQQVRGIDAQMLVHHTDEGGARRGLPGYPFSLAGSPALHSSNRLSRYTWISAHLQHSMRSVFGPDAGGGTRDGDFLAGGLGGPREAARTLDALGTRGREVSGSADALRLWAVYGMSADNVSMVLGLRAVNATAMGLHGARVRVALNGPVDHRVQASGTWRLPPLPPGGTASWTLEMPLTGMGLISVAPQVFYDPRGTGATGRRAAAATAAHALPHIDIPITAMLHRPSRPPAASEWFAMWSAMPFRLEVTGTAATHGMDGLLSVLSAMESPSNNMACVWRQTVRSLGSVQAAYIGLGPRDEPVPVMVIGQCVDAAASGGDEPRPPEGEAGRPAVWEPELRGVVRVLVRGLRRQLIESVREREGTFLEQLTGGALLHSGERRTVPPWPSTAQQALDVAPVAAALEDAPYGAAGGDPRDYESFVLEQWKSVRAM